MRNFNEHQESLDALIASTAAYTAATHTAATLILQFGDESCAPCHAIRHKLDAWLANHPDVAARYIDIQTHLALCSQIAPKLHLSHGIIPLRQMPRPSPKN